MVGIYARQSVERENSISIETQIEYCRKELTVGEDVRVYQDRGYSGANTDRPEFQKLMKDIGNGRIQKVVVYKLDRISRSLLDFSKIQETFTKHDVEFISVIEKFDTSTEIGRAMLGIVMVFAQLERETIQRRVRDAFYERMKQGFFVGGATPFGFVKKPATINGIKTQCLEADPDTEWIVREMYDLYVREGASIGSIVKKMNQSPAHYGLNAPTSNVTVSRILRNPVYVRADADVYQYLSSKKVIMVDDISAYDGTRGCFIYGKRNAKTTSKFTDLYGDYAKLWMHEGLIPANQWLRVQYKLDSNRQVRNSGKGTHSWLSGVIKCGYCGFALTVVNGQSNGKRYVNCGGRKKNICNGRKEAATFDEIEKAVEKDLLRYMTQYQYSSLSGQRNQEQEINKVKIELQRTGAEIQKIEDKLENIDVDEFIHVAEACERKLAKLKVQKQEIEQKLARISIIDTQDISGHEIHTYLASWDSFSIEEKKAAARLFISTVYVTDGEIRIVYRIGVKE